MVEIPSAPGSGTAVERVAFWLDGASDDDLIELEAREMRALLAEHAAEVKALRAERKVLDGYVAIWHDAALVQHDVDEIRCQTCRAYMSGPLKSPTTLSDLVALAGRHECLPRLGAAGSAS